MANSPQARKRAKQNEKRRQHNASMRSMARTYLKKVNAAIEAGDVDKAKAAYAAAVSVLDRYAGKGGILSKNKASRHKSRLNAKIKALSA
ncbi:MAG: 30S ribosomal protein S20 [Gammaproteobacteria bacterium]|nr:MAG: 30S ribosomal protein S20 [Gammaproteobacteria bacterium]RLA49031.1 MAG: 30S ribosomal protein S20 [Gammaproteobacteria bacterium]